MAAPKYDSPQIPAAGPPERYISVDTNADMFGAGVGRALEGFGATVTQVAGLFDANAERLRKEAAKTAANQAFVDASMAMNEAEATYLQTMGANAASGYKPYLENLKTIREEALSALEDDDAKQLFDTAIQSNVLSGMNTGAVHAAQQGKAAAVEASSARVELILKDSSTKFADEELFQSNLSALDEQLVNQANLLGWSPEVLLEKQHTLHSLAWESRITSQAASDPLGAQQTFMRVRDELTVENRLRVQSAVQTAANVQALEMGKRSLITGANEDVRPAFRESIINGGRNTAADQFLLTRTNKGPDSVLGMHPVTADRLAALIQAAPPGIRENITIFSGHRSLEHQAALYRASGGSGMVAKPSPGAPHVRGDAADLGWKGGSFRSMPKAAQDWLHANAEAFGLVFRLGNEPWHIERAVGPRRAPAMEQGSFVNRILFAEGGGAGIYSPAGAAGLMQVMPDTGRLVARQLGIPFDAWRLAHDDQYNLLIGTTYLNQMLNQFGGNETLASAAYNAGPGKVLEWIARFGDPRLGEISNEAWAARIPFDETRGYVQKVVGGAGTPNNRPVTANMSRAEFDVKVQEARAWAEMNYPGNLQFAEAYVSGMEQSYNDMIATQKAQIAENYDSILGLVIDQGEDGRYMNQAQFNALLQSQPELAERWDALDSTKKNTIQKQLRQNDKLNGGGDKDVTTDESLAEYDRLRGMAMVSPGEFNNQDIAANDTLTQAQKKELINLKYQKTPESAVPKDIDLNKALGLAKPALATLEISPKDTPELYQKFVGSLSRQLAEEQTAKGSKLNTLEVQGIIQRLLTERQSEGFWPWSNNRVLEFELNESESRFIGAESVETLTPTPTIPDDVRSAIVGQYTTKYGYPPSQAVILQIYEMWSKTK